MSERETETDEKCVLCLGRVDAEGYTTGDCPVAKPNECESCGACFCDGSC